MWASNASFFYCVSTMIFFITVWPFWEKIPVEDKLKDETFSAEIFFNEKHNEINWLSRVLFSEYPVLSQRSLLII